MNYEKIMRDGNYERDDKGMRCAAQSSIIHSRSLQFPPKIHRCHKNTKREETCGGWRNGEKSTQAQQNILSNYGVDRFINFALAR